MYWLIGFIGYLLAALCAWTAMSGTQNHTAGALKYHEPYPQVVPVLIGPLLMVVVLFAISAFLLFAIKRATWKSSLDKSFAWCGGIVFAFYLVVLAQQ